MIRSLHVKNFRCLRDVEIAFEPLTVLVGANASGKTALVKALDPHATLTHEDVWQHGKHHARFNVGFDDGSGFDIEIPHGNRKDNHGEFKRYSYQLLHLDLGRARTPNQVQHAAHLTSTGDNLANVVASLTRKQQSSLAERLCSLVPMFVDVDVRPLSAGTHELLFQDRWNKAVWYRPEEVSDGTMLLTAYLTLQYQDPPVDLVAVEEPERGLHPYLIGELVKLLRKLSRGELGGKPMQIVLATHSAELLEHVQPEEVRFLSRDPSDGGVRVRSIDVKSPDWQAAYREYSESLGEAWLSGGLGGVPGSAAGG